MLRWLICGGLFWIGGLRAEVLLPAVLNSHMVLQREAPVPIWGVASPGTQVTVRFGAQVKTAVAGADHRWEVVLEPMPASWTPREMVIEGQENRRVLEDVLVGEVWLAAGQSNMEWPLKKIAKDEQALARELLTTSRVRVFHVHVNQMSMMPLFDTFGEWKRPGEILEKFDSSAVAFFFADRLQRELGVPVACLEANWGGKVIEFFISDEGNELAGLPSAPPSSEALASHLEAMRQEMEKLQGVVERAGKGVYLPIDNQALGWGYAQNGIYNAMIAPLTPYALRGAIWYQGESNRRSDDYFDKLRALSLGWSKAFRVPGMPIYQVQIAPYDYDRNPKDLSSMLCDHIWAAQYRAAEEIPGMGVVPIHDTIDNIKDIHPDRKQTVGERLAALALRRNYGQEVPASGARVASATLEEGKVVVRFRGLTGELTTVDDQPPSWYELSSDGETFVKAEAELSGQTVRVLIPAAMSPTHVRMGWRDIATPNLKDDATGWPVFPFPAHAIQTTTSRPNPELLP